MTSLVVAAAEEYITLYGGLDSMRGKHRQTRATPNPFLVLIDEPADQRNRGSHFRAKNPRPL